MKIQVKYKRLPHQAEFHADKHSPMLMMSGGYGSGKTFALCNKILDLSAINIDTPGGILVPTFRDYKRDVLPTFKDIAERNGWENMLTIHKTDFWLMFPWSRHPIYIFSAENDIKGPNLGFCGINEHSMIPYDKIQQMLARVRLKSAPVPQKCFAGTPEDKFGWLHDFVDKQTKAGLMRLIVGKTWDNYHLDPLYVEHLKATMDPLQFRLFAGGEMITLGKNLFYYSYSREKNSTNELLDPDLPIFINLDFNVGNMTATVAQIKKIKEKRVVFFVDEITLTESGADTYAMINRINETFTVLKHKITITCDASGASRKTTGMSDVKAIEAAGYVVRYRMSGNPRLRERQILVNGLLHHEQILINHEKCPGLVADLQRVQQKEDFTKDKSNPRLTHKSDTMDYLIDQEFEIQSREKFHQYKVL